MNDASLHPVLEMAEVSVGSLRDPAVTVITAVNWAVAAGEFWVIAGGERSGKTDLLMLAAGLMPPASGSCRVFGRETQEFGEAELAQRLRVGLVFADGKLFSHLTLAENIALPLRYQNNLTVEEVAPEVETLLEWFELKPFADLTPANVPAHWRQRAAMARALILKPEILLLDNPLGGQSARHHSWPVTLLDQLWRGHAYLGGRPLTVIVATDDLRPWQHDRHQFALLHLKKLLPLGDGKALAKSAEPLVKELLAASASAT